MARPVSKLLRDERPDLAAQVVDKSLLDTLGVGSTREIEWYCDKGHHYTLRVDRRVYARKATCPVCSGRILVPGVNDLATLAPDVAELCADPDDAYRYAPNSSKRLLWRCENGHEWTAPIARLTMQGSRCPYCSGRLPIIGETDLATTHPELAEELVDHSLATKIKAGTPRKVLWRCKHGHTYEASPYDRTAAKTGCPYCSHRYVVPNETSLAVVMPDIARHLLHPEQAYEITPGSSRKLQWVCEKNPRHIWRCTVRNYQMGGCPYCDGKRILVGENDLATTHPDIAKELADPSLATRLVAGSGKRVEWVCEHGHHWMAAPCDRTGHHTGCPECANVGTSEKEKDFCDVIRRLVPNETVLTNDRTYLEGRYELDVVIPDARVALEFNGCMWHSEKFHKPNTYHRDKARMAHDAGLRLIQVWEDDWNARRDVVVRAIAHKLNALDRLQDVLEHFDPTMIEHIGARELEARRISGADAHEFLEQNHIQGSVTATLHYGLIDGDGHIRAVLSARSPRSNARMKRASGEWEIQRYATCGVVPGGFTKLMRFAEKDIVARGHELTRWISFSANDISDGSMYGACGFAFDREMPPSYFYVGNRNRWVREPKEKYQRKRFRSDPGLKWDESWTEHEAALANGLYRIYDAGKIRWVKEL